MKNILLSIFLLSFLTEAVFAQRSTPDFLVVDIYGDKHQLFENYLDNGNYVLLEFFSVGCVTCQATARIYNEIFLEYGCNCGELVVLGIDGWTYDQYVWEFSFNNSVTFPLASGQEGMGYKPIDLYNVLYTPHKVLLSPQGDFLMNNDIVINSADDLRAVLETHNIQKTICSGNDFLYLEIDGFIAEINKDNNTAQIVMPAVRYHNAKFRLSGNSKLYHNGEELFSEEEGTFPIEDEYTDFQIISESGEIADWTLHTIFEGTNVNSLNDKQIRIQVNTGGELAILPGFSANDAIVRVTDVNGRIIENFETTISPDTPVLLKKTSNYPTGIYFIQLVGQDFSVLQKWTKIE